MNRSDDSRPLRTVIADDEPDAREHIRLLLGREPDVEIVAACSNGRDVVKAVKELKPDLLFLDIQMPYLTGFEVLCALQNEHMPVIVFVTAYDQYALEAFEVNATDYLLKPFGTGRFKGSMEKARQQVGRVRRDGVTASHEPLLQAVSTSAPQLRRVLAHRAGRVQFLNIEDVKWVDVSGNYLAFHFETYTHFIKGSLNRVFERLDPKMFFRIHRSTIVNLRMVESIDPGAASEYTVVLKDKTRLPLSRRKHTELVNLLSDDSVMG